MNPIDLEFREVYKATNDFINGLKKDYYEYDDYGPIDATIFEFMLCNMKTYNVFARDITGVSNKRKLRFYHGSGLLRAIKYYIIDDNVFSNLKIFTEYNGLKFSELPRYIQRKIEEATVLLTVDYSFRKSDEDEIIRNYSMMLRSLA